MQDFTRYTPNAQTGVGARAGLGSEALFFQRVYAWMCAGLALTAGTAFFLSTSESWLMFLARNTWTLWAAAALELGLVFYLSARIHSLAPGTARGVFLAYSALNGLTFSVLLLVYPTSAFIQAFVCTAGLYGAMAVYGLITKRSLEAWGSFLFMGVIGLILASLVNIIFGSFFGLDVGRFSFGVSILGVLIFAGLTAYDHQKLRVMHYELERSAGGFDAGDMAGRAVIAGALTLYLDFINIFLFLLRLFGRRE